jgi:integrase/recombinase XerD
MAEPNLFKREGIWWLRVKVNGYRYRESMRTADLREARKFRDKRLKEIRNTSSHGDAVLWKGVIVEWLQHIKGQLSSATQRRYVTSIKLIMPLMDPDTTLTIDRVDGRLIARLMQDRRASGASAATIRRDLTAISSVLNYSEAMGWSEGNAALSKRRLLRERRDPISLPTETAYAAVLEVASPELRALIVAARLTGCRQGELVTAKWSQFDAKTGALAVIGKGNKRRTIKLSPEAEALIKGQPRKSDFIFCWPPAWRRDSMASVRTSGFRLHACSPGGGDEGQASRTTVRHLPLS